MTIYCPVCEVEIPEESAAIEVPLEDEVLFFCSDECLAAYEREPELFVDFGAERRGDRPSAPSG